MADNRLKYCKKLQERIKRQKAVSAVINKASNFLNTGMIPVSIVHRRFVYLCKSVVSNCLVKDVLFIFRSCTV